MVRDETTVDLSPCWLLLQWQKGAAQARPHCSVQVASGARVASLRSPILRCDPNTLYNSQNPDKANDGKEAVAN